MRFLPGRGVGVGGVDVRLTGKGDSKSHDTRPVNLIITMKEWIRTSRLSTKNSLCGGGGAVERERNTFNGQSHGRMDSRHNWLSVFQIARQQRARISHVVHVAEV